MATTNATSIEFGDKSTKMLASTSTRSALPATPSRDLYHNDANTNNNKKRSPCCYTNNTSKTVSTSCSATTLSLEDNESSTAIATTSPIKSLLNNNLKQQQQKQQQQQQQQQQDFEEDMDQIGEAEEVSIDQNGSITVEVIQRTGITQTIQVKERLYARASNIIDLDDEFSKTQEGDDDDDDDEEEEDDDEHSHHSTDPIFDQILSKEASPKRSSGVCSNSTPNHNDKSSRTLQRRPSQMQAEMIEDALRESFKVERARQVAAQVKKAVVVQRQAPQHQDDILETTHTEAETTTSEYSAPPVPTMIIIDWSKPSIVPEDEPLERKYRVLSKDAKKKSKRNAFVSLLKNSRKLFFRKKKKQDFHFIETDSDFQERLSI